MHLPDKSQPGFFIFRYDAIKIEYLSPGAGKVIMTNSAINKRAKDIPIAAP